ncbi:exonuclease domain-containing protein [Nesterenkonia alkaliphila]|uniref:exonuclease domain-containing protein n=1 Tax=Nesterenkonia alkaliphila TaxID=1463631 RepID=UPI0019889029|nr:exonuclease domain-containing protein [Nesterenkonia alkaliphila]GFZ93282.1 DNA polymerase III subunit epsilon [Nesterenkonia alkaliphila]
MAASASPLGGALAGLRPPRVRGLDFTAVDFETANGFRGSPCAIGMVRIRDGNVDELYFKRMRPPAGFDRFDPRNVEIHGITPQRVAAEPRFGELFGEIREFIGTDTLVAHNAAFDAEVFESALEVSGLDSPGGLRMLCSVRLARAVYQLDSHALPKAAAEAGFHLKHHHHALWDARAAAAIVVDIAERQRTNRLQQLFAAQQIEAEELEAWTAPRAYESRATRQVRSYAHLLDATAAGVTDAMMPDLMRWQEEGRNLPPSPEADPGHPLYGQHLVFSGNLALPRPEAKALAAEHGATTSSKVIGATTMLVIGDGVSLQDIEQAVHGGAPVAPMQARKVREALARRAKGQPIRILTESEFRELLGQRWPLPR